MQRIAIANYQKGLLFKNGEFVKLLEPGRYTLFKSAEVEIVQVNHQPIITHFCPLDTLLENGEFRRRVSVVEVTDEQLALHFVNGQFASVLKSGKYAFWAIGQRHEFRFADISTPIVDPSIPEYIFSKMPPLYFTRVEVAPYQKARLYFNQKFERLLDSGVYYFWKNWVKIDVSYVDTRLMQMNIAGQELLTQDKISLRINFVCHYRVADYVKSLTEIDDFTEQMHVAAQLALREYVGKYKLDEILENKDQMSQFVFEKLKAKEKDLFVEITDAGVKDIILPGEIRQIMNTVLVAEKRAQANVIARREEVASTRSLLNTAKLMDESQTLYKLKELEYVERICGNIGSISLNGSGGVLAQLTDVLQGKRG